MSDLSTYLRPWLLSLEIAASATVINTAVGLPLGYMLGRKQFPGKSLVEALVILPLVLPPTVVGFFLLYLLGRHGLAGVLSGGAVSFLFTLPGAVIASAVVSLPLIVLPTRAAFASLPQEYLEEARMSGATPLQTFFLIAVPIARRGVLSGLLLGFGRALGEFGATIMVLGTAERTRTLALQIYVDAGQSDNFADAWPPVLALACTSLLAIMLANRYRWLDPL